jgi:hypothetical protein
MRRLALIALIALMSPLLHAQCSGVDTGGGGCVPPSVLYPDQYGNGGGQTYAPRLPDRWGSVYRSAEDNVWSEARGYLTRGKAQSAAKADCKARGGQHCEELTSFANTCLGISQSAKGAVGWTTSPDPYAAKEDSVKACRDESCQSIYLECSLPTMF